MARSATLTLFALLVAWPAAAQRVGEIGRPYFRTFSAEEYDAHVWNSSAVQDDRGVLYVGNNDGLLEYDGVSWRLIVLPGRSHVGSLARDRNGRIWVGGLEDMGFVAPDSTGRSRFVSVRANAPEGLGSLSFVRGAHASDDGIWFRTTTRLFRYRPDPADPARGELVPVDLGPGSIRTFDAGGRVVVWREGEGLAWLVDDRLEPLPGGRPFADRDVVFVADLDDETLLIGTRSRGLFTVRAGNVAPFGSEGALPWSGLQVQAGVVLPGGRVALGTLQSGLLILDMAGRVVQRIDATLGLPTNNVRSLYVDDSGALWLLLEKGITRVETHSPFSLFDGTLGMDDVAVTVLRHGGRLFAGTVAGLRVLDPGTGRFRPVPGVTGTVSALLSVGDDLLAASARGVHVLSDGRLRPVTDESSYMLVRMTDDGRVVLAGLNDGVALLRHAGGRWTELGRIGGVEGLIRSGVRLSDGTVWVGSESGGVYRIRAVGEEWTDPNDLAVRAFGPEDGLPEHGASVYKVGDRPYFTAFGGKVYGLDATGERLVRVHTFDDMSTGYPLDWYGFHEDSQGRIWAPVGNRGMSAAFPSPDGGYVVRPGPLRRLGSVLVIVAYPEPDGIVWMAGSDGLIRYDTEWPVGPPVRRSVLIRNVATGEDSLLYGGNGPPRDIELRYRRNTMQVDYALPVFAGASRYRTLLEGFDDEWTPWSTSTSRTYTNLPEDDYVFRVDAVDIDGNAAGAAELSFTVLPPWFRTIWAYLAYVSVGVGLLFLLRRYEMSRLRLKYRLELEHLESRRLRDLDRVRTDFFANISHEFRTPLTLILGPVADALDRGVDLARHQMELVRENGNRLLRLINQILDLSKLEAGGMELRATRSDIVPFLSGLLFSFESLAQNRGVELSFSTSHRRLPVLYERDRLEQVFLNLLANAIRFTDPGGTVRLSCRRAGEGHVEITVQDTGRGIPADRLPHIFDRFYQSGSAPDAEREGTGIGLALTRALVDLHDGEITVESEVGVGTTFTVRLPTGAAGGDPGEGVELEPEPSAEEDPDASDGRAIVLVVEDHPDVRAYVVECLDETYRVLQARNGAEGLDEARAHMPDLIVVDVAMPGMDGYEMSRAIRGDERTSHIPIVMLTARAAEEDKIAGLETGVDDYLLKPFNPRELRLRVRNLIAQREEARRKFGRAAVVRPSEVEATSLDQAFLGRVMDSIESHMDDERYGVEILSDDVGMSVSQLNRKLNALIDQPAGSLIRSTRLHRAADLLEQRAGTVSEIAYRVGFSSAAHFSTSFKKQFGVPPSAYPPDDEE